MQAGVCPCRAGGTIPGRRSPAIPGRRAVVASSSVHRCRRGGPGGWCTVSRPAVEAHQVGVFARAHQRQSPPAKGGGPKGGVGEWLRWGIHSCHRHRRGARASWPGPSIPLTRTRPRFMNSGWPRARLARPLGHQPAGRAASATLGYTRLDQLALAMPKVSALQSGHGAAVAGAGGGSYARAVGAEQGAAEGRRAGAGHAGRITPLVCRAAPPAGQAQPSTTERPSPGRATDGDAI